MLDASAYSSLICPFPSGINSLAGAANEYVLQWAAAFKLIPKKFTLGTALQRMNYGWLGARVHPHAPLAALQLTTCWHCWLFFVDDLNDESDEGKDPEQLKRVHARLNAILNGSLATRSDLPSVQALAEIHARMQRLGNPECLRRFRQGVEDYLAGCRWEAGNRSAQHIPDPEAYSRGRLATSAVYPCLELIDIAENICLPVEVRDHPQLKELSRMTNHIIAWCNDIISLQKELKHGDVHNLVIVLAHHHKISLKAASQMAIIQHNTEVHAYLELESQLPSFGPEVDTQVQRYVQGLRSWMRGHFDWALTARRFSLSSSSPRPEVK